MPSTDLDLDALAATASRGGLNLEQTLALIQRVREVEVLADDWRHAFHDTRSALALAVARTADLERVALEFNRALNDVLDAYPYSNPQSMPARRRALDALMHHAALSVVKGPA